MTGIDITELDRQLQAEVRNKLTIVRGYADLIASDSKVPSSAQNQAKTISRAADGIYTLLGFKEQDIAVAVAVAEAHVSNYNAHPGANKE